MEIWLSVQIEGGDARDVAISGDPNCTVDQLADALARHVGLDESGLFLRCDRTGEALDPDSSLGASALLTGDQVTLTRSTVSLSRASKGALGRTIDLVVVGGPFTGRRVPLKEARQLVGRGDECDVQFDDPSMSRSHFWLHVSKGSVRVADAGSRNGTWLEAVQVKGDETALPPGKVLCAGRSVFQIEPAPAAAESPRQAHEGRIPFNRPPRLHRPVQLQALSLSSPPPDPQKARLPVAASLGPLLMGGLMFGLMQAANSASGSVASLAFMALSPLMAIGSLIESQRTGKSQFKKRAREYREELARLDADLARALADEAERRRAAAPGVADLLDRAINHRDNLWERRPEDEDFLALRVGLADQPATTSVEREGGGNEELRGEGDQVIAGHSTVPAVPVVAPLREAGVLGLAGPADRVDSLGRWLVAQAAALHSPRFLQVAAAVPADAVRQWDWLKWLPHTRPDVSVLEEAHLAAGPAAARDLLTNLSKLLRRRLEKANARYGGEPGGQPFMVVLLHQDVVERALATDLLAGGLANGIGVIWLGERARDLPGECRVVIELDPEVSRLSFTETATGRQQSDVTADGLEPELAKRLATALAPLRDTSAGGHRARIPARITLLELLQMQHLSAASVRERWNEGSKHRGAPIGAGAAGPFLVDLRTDGPHALIGGTTGSGKSELLQTMVAAWAITHPPSRLTFLLVDYKGAAAFKDCQDFPHTVGLVTDLDGHLVQRALVSLGAEIRRRERILKAGGAKNLREMERRDPDNAPASLVLIVDEFAALAKELPEFVDGVVDIAQRGRSLGVHLILATQKPTGVINDKIRANTDLRLALRVSDEQDSTDVIGIKDAAHIPRSLPGRAFARRGQNEVVEFQSAYVGETADRSGAKLGITVRTLAFSGPERSRRHSTVVPVDTAAVRTELQRIGEVIREAHAEVGLPLPPPPWLPPLPESLLLEGLEGRVEPNELGPGVAVLGLVDRPQLQRQEPFLLDFGQEGNLLIYGASGSGKSTLLRAIAVSLATHSSPDELNVYGIDFGTRALKVLEALPHVGSVVPGEDEERVNRLFTMLRLATAHRRDRFAHAGVSSYDAYVRSVASSSALPRIVVLLDGYAGFASAYEKVNLGELLDALPRLASDGRGFGIHFAITADRRAAVPAALSGAVPSRVILAMATEDEYGMLGIRPAAVRGVSLPPGRGFVEGGVEIQCAQAGGDGLDLGQESERDAIERIGADFRSRSPDAVAPKVEVLPPVVPRASMPPPLQPLQAVIGVAELDLGPAAIDLHDGHFLVVGPYRSGRSTALATIVGSLRQADPGLDVRLLSPRERSPLLSMDLWSSRASGADACVEAARGIAGEVSGWDPATEHPPLVVVIDDGEELAEGMAAQPLDQVVRRGRDTNVRVLVAAETQAAQRVYSGWLKEVRKERQGLLLTPRSEVDGDQLFDVRLPRRSKWNFPAGRGFLIARGGGVLVQVAAAPEER